MPDPASRYTAVAIVLHWAIATAILVNAGIGWWMHDAIEAPGTEARAVAAFQLHKSIGLTILVLSLARLGWRLLHPPPPLPAAMARRERLAAKAIHACFYALMIAIPLSGWLYVSTQWRGDAPLRVPTLWFGLFEVPHLFSLDAAADAWRESVAAIAFDTHSSLVWATLLLLAGHVGAALKHQFVDRDAVLGQMIPALAKAGGSPRHGRRRVVLGGGFVLIGTAVAAIALALIRPPGGSAGFGVGPSGGAATDAITAAGGGWPIDPSRSRIGFAGVHAGTPFSGRFTRWQADIRIDADDIAASRIAATIHTGSAVDGVSLHERTLPQAEWFDTANHPVAEFRATGVRSRDDGRYDVAGVLTIKDNDIPIRSLELEVSGDTATITGRLTLDRADADLGMESDPGGNWVSREIEVDLRATVERGD